jgi:hypothetical protein
MPSVLDYGTLSAVDPAAATNLQQQPDQVQPQQSVDTSAPGHYEKYAIPVSQGGYLKPDGNIDTNLADAGQAALASGNQAQPVVAQQQPNQPLPPQQLDTSPVNQNAVIGSEFGEVDRPSRGGYTEPNWNIGAWGDNLEGFDNQGVALPADVLSSYGNRHDKDFANNFNNQYDVVVTNPKTGQTTVAPLKDIGPGKSTGAGLDMLGGTRSALGLEQNFKGPVTYAVVPKGSAGSLTPVAYTGTPGEAPLAPWDIEMAQLQANPQSATLGGLFGQIAQREAGGPTVQVSAPQPQQRTDLAGGHAIAQDQGGPSGQPTFSWTLPQHGSLQDQTRPDSFGLRVATDDDVRQYQNYVKLGGDPGVINVYDKLAIALKQDPTFLTRPENVGVYKELIKDPITAQSKGQTASQAVGNAINQGWRGLGDVANDVKAFAGTMWNDALPAVRYTYAKATGQVPDQDATRGTADFDAVVAQGSTKLVSDLYSMVAGADLMVGRLATNIGETFTTDPAKKAQLEKDYTLAQQQNVANQQHLYDLGQTLQSKMADAYTWTGAFADLGNQLRSAQPDPKAVAGFSQIAQLVPALEGLSALRGSMLVKPLMVDSTLAGAEDTAVAAARKFAADNSQLVPPNVAEEAANANYVAGRSAQAALAPEARAANAGFTQAQQDLAAKLTSQQKIAGDPGVATQFQAGLANVAAGATDAVGNIAKGMTSIKDRLLNITSFGNPTFRAIQEKVLGMYLFGHGVETGHAFAGRLMEAGMDMAEQGPEIAEATSRLSDMLRIYGREKLYGETTTPFYTRLDQALGGVNPRLASFLDSPAVQTFGHVVGGTIGGAAVGGALGAATSPDDPLGGAVGGAMFGGVLGMAGAGFGQWVRYKDPQAHYMALRGDWQRTRSMLGAADQQSFSSLAPHDQLMIGTYMQQHPGLRLKFVSDPAGPSGMHFFDEADRPTVQINTANPESTTRGLFAHELMHQVQTAGMMPDAYDALLGNPQRGTLGQYTATDARGNPIMVNGSPIDPTTGRYYPDQKFLNYKGQYIKGLQRANEPYAQVSNLHIAKELYAEHGVDYMLSGKAAVDSSSAYRPGWMNSEGMKTALAHLGFSFNDNGGIVQGSGLFDGVQRNSALDNLTQRYFQMRAKDRQYGKPADDFQGTRKFSPEDFKDPKSNVANTFLDTAPEFKRDTKTGEVLRDNNGAPIYRSPKEVKQYNAQLANDMLDRVNALPEDRKADIGLKVQPNGNTFVRYLPADLRDALANTNEYNPHQIDALSSLSENMADKSKMGTQFRIFYNKALSVNKKYGQFEGEERFVTPIGFEITKDKNVNLKSVDFAQLNNNYLRKSKQAPYKGLWGNLGEFNADADTYFQNHARGNPGADGIGPAKRDAINSLFGLETELHRESNPLLAGSDNSGVRSIIKSFRIDRASQVDPKEKGRAFNDLAQYTMMNKNYRPRTGETAPLEATSTP